MRFFAFFALGAVVIACGGGSNVAGPSPSPSSSSSSPVSGAPQCGVVTADACKPAFHVATAAELIAATRAFDYQPVSISKGQKLEVGDDLVADADIEVAADDLPPLGSDCRDCQTPLFRAQAFPSSAEIPGVRCMTRSEKQPVREAFACSRIEIAKGTTFRLRAVIEDMHPSAPTYWAFIDFTEACATSCAAGQVLCAASHTCFAAGFAACLYCDGREPAYCACRDESCGQKPNGTACNFSSSPDVEEVGVCGDDGCRPMR